MRELQFNTRKYFKALVEKLPGLQYFVYETESGEVQSKTSGQIDIYPCLALVPGDGVISENEGDANFDTRTETLYLSVQKNSKVDEGEQWDLLRQLRNEIISNMKYWDEYELGEGQTLRELLNISEVRYFAQASLEINNSFGYLIEFDCSENIDLSLDEK